MSDLEVRQIRPGLWRWTAPHPEWSSDKGGPGGWERTVGSIYYEARGALVLIDPLVPPLGTSDEERFWKHLDADVQRLKWPVEVILGSHHHERSAAEIYRRYRTGAGAEVRIHEAGRESVRCPVTRTFTPSRGLPPGIQAFSISGLNPDEVVFWIPEHRALVPADAILGAGGGRLRVAPRTWSAGGEEGLDRYDSWFLAEIRALLDLPVEMILVSHGEPVLENGRKALVEALASPAWGD